MILTIKNDGKVNLKALKEEIGDFVIVQEPHTKTLPDNTVEYYGYILDIDDKEMADEDKVQIEAKAKAHKPAKSDKEEEADIRKQKEVEAQAASFKAVFTHLLKNDGDFLAYLTNVLTGKKP